MASTQITAWAAEGLRVSVTLAPQTGGFAHCSAYPDRSPILSAWDGGAAVTITPPETDHVTDADVRFARRLAQATAAYLAEVQRLHTTQTDKTESVNAASVA